jgi:NTE family protein
MANFDYKNIENINETLDKELINVLNKKELKKNKTILVLSGGGVKGIALIGALKALYDSNILQNIKTIASSSVGSIIALFYIAGYEPEEMFSVLKRIKLGSIKTINPIDLIDKFGMDDGKKLDSVLSLILEAKNIDKNITLLEFYKKTKITFIITASCMNNKQAYYLSHKTFPEMSVTLAVRMSSALPIYFAPIIYDNKTFIDGGCIDNYPIHLFKDRLEYVIGIYLSDIRDYTSKINKFDEFLGNLIQCLFEGQTIASLQGYEKQTIRLSLPTYGSWSLDLTEKKREEIFQMGYKIVIDKLNKNIS